VSRRPVALALVVLLAAIGWMTTPYLAAAALVFDLSGSTLWIRRVLPVRVRSVASRDLQIPTRFGPVPARLYQPSGPRRRSVMVFPGIHAGGVGEPRLDAFSRRLAATGVTVLSVPLPELRHYHVTPVSTDMIEDAALWTTADPMLAPRGRVVLAGVSFAGGLALVAGGRPSLTGKLDSIVALGAHADLPRVMTYLCTGQLVNEAARRPHSYGVSVILMAALPSLLPADQVEPAQRALTKFLDASSAEHADPEQAAALFEDARASANDAPEPARTLLMLANDRDVAALGPRLLPYVESLGGAAALSPDRSPAPTAPVFLVHGEMDNVIPSSETPLLARYVRAGGNPHVRFLLTPLLSHADVQAPGVIDAWRLIHFWKDALDE